MPSFTSFTRIGNGDVEIAVLFEDSLTKLQSVLVESGFHFRRHRTDSQERLGDGLDIIFERGESFFNHGAIVEKYGIELLVFKSNFAA